VSLCDLPATVIDLLGLGHDHAFAGRSVSRYWQPHIQLADGSEELYNMTSDVGEIVNLAGGLSNSPVLLQFRNLLELMLTKR
jgi:arylsulfatase A-like enzyme